LLNSNLNRKAKKKQLNKENQATKLINNYTDTARMRKNSVYRSEVTCKKLCFYFREEENTYIYSYVVKFVA